MRPIKLTMEAFGPFLSETVDFDAFGDNLFLISGVTGSGKTTIFDGICYALYGEASGDDRLPDGMKSDFAPVGTACAVTLIFDVRGKIYRIRRMPHQQMFNSHHTGLKEQKHEAELWQLEKNGSDKLLCNNITDIKNKISELLGLNASQFRQIVMLPQGRFSRLLKAGEKERADLLKTLFPMTFYKEFEKRLEQEAKDAENTYNALTEQIDRKRDDFIAKPSSSLAEVLSAAETPIPLVLSAADEQNEEDKKEEKRIKEAIEAQNKQLDMLNMAIVAGEAQIARFDKMDELTKKLNALKSRNQNIKKLSERIDVTQSVQRVMPFENAMLKERERVKNAAGELGAAKDKCQEAQKRWEALEPEIKKVNSDAFNTALNDNRKLVEKIKDQQDALEKMAVHAEKRSRLRNEAKALKVEVDNLNAAEAEQKKITDELIKLTETIAEVQREKSSVDFQVSLFQHTEKAAAAIAKNLSDYAKREQTIEVTQKQITNLREHIKETEVALAQAKAIDRDNRAAALAAELKAGEPCPVCGSVHHPVIAPNKTHDKKSEDVNGLTDQLTELTAALGSAETKLEMMQNESRTYLQSAERELAEVRSVVAGSFESVPSDILNYDIEVMTAALHRRRTAISQSSRQIAESLKDYDNQKKSMDARLAELKQRIASCSDIREKYEAKKEEYNNEHTLCHSIAENLKSIELDIKTPGKLQTAKNDLESKLTMTLRAVADAESKQKKIAENVTETKSDLSAAKANQSAAEKNLRESEMAAAQAAEAFERELMQAKLSSEQYDANKHIDSAKLRNDQKILENYHRELSNTQDNLATLKKELLGKTKPDIEALKLTKAAHLEKINNLNQDLKTTEIRLNANIKVASDLKDLYKALQSAESRFGLLNGLNKTVKGTVPGKQKMSFERYILSAYLSDVLERANLFLEMISDGRYRLELPSITEGKQGRGLSIAVFDEYTGKARNASSLSGGETFMAALSMALGLSDMVSEQKGALTIDTLFIDEGFATLDAEAREKAMTCLAKLRRQGRSVGIISHVSELIDLIDDKIIVQKTDEGSHIQLVK